MLDDERMLPFLLERSRYMDFNFAYSGLNIV